MSYIVTYAGNKFDYNNIKKRDFDVADIFRSLPRLNRFVGHSTRAYSVAEHSLYCWLMARKLGYSDRLQFLVLIHDFTEAYVGDCPAPLKRMIPDFSEIEKRVELALYDFFEIEPPTEDEHYMIKRIDLTMLAIEMRDLTVHKHEDFIDVHVYKEIMQDNNFIISKEDANEGEIKDYLESVCTSYLNSNKK